MWVNRLRRREFITLLGGAAVATCPVATRAQQPRKIAKIGLLDYAPFWKPLLEALRELGYVENQNVVFEYRPTHGKSEQLSSLAADLALRDVDIIVTFGAVATLAARSATTTTPLRMIGVGDPLGTGLVASLAHPGANITGNTIFGAELGAKRLELLREMVPSVSRIAFLWNPSNPANALHFDEVQRGAISMRCNVAQRPSGLR